MEFFTICLNIKNALTSEAAVVTKSLVIASSCRRGVKSTVWKRGTFQVAKNLERCRKSREMRFRTEYQFSTELPFTRGSFTASVRDHNLREASHLFYEGKE